MDPEWLPAIATAVVSALGIGFTYKAGERQIETALQVSKDQSDASLAAQREERLQRRIEAAYQELLILLGEEWEWVKQVYPIFTATREQ